MARIPGWAIIRERSMRGYSWNREKDMRLGVWIAVGIVIGTLIGYALSQTALGVAFGAAFGIAGGSISIRKRQ
jgi:uncharacterized membrane protein YfcA